MAVKIMIGADLVPTESNYEYFRNGDAQSLIGSELQKKLKSADFTIFNLEVPLVKQLMPIDKFGPNLSAPIYTIKGLQAINPYFFTLANNHILDQGEQGLYSTIQILKENNIAFAGAGKNLEEARKPYIVEIKGLVIGIYCCAEHEFTIAQDDKAGANPFDPLESFEHIENLKKKCNYVIVLYHGGKEHYRYPSPYLQKVCRKFVAKGADLVVCQHSHCIGSKEEWDYQGQKGTIIYGQGNFLFDDSDSEYWKTSLLLEVNLDKGMEIRYIPIEKKDGNIQMATMQAKKIIEEFDKRSTQIKDSKLVENMYKQYAEGMKIHYLSRLQGRKNKSFAFRALNKLSGYRLERLIYEKQYQKKDGLNIVNCIECEAHRELLLQIVKNINN